MNKSTIEKVIRAFEEIVEDREIDLPTEEEIEEVMPLPPGFEQRLRKEIKEGKKYIYIWGKRVSKVAILILAILLTGVTVYAVARSKFFYKIFSKYTEISTFEEELEEGKEYLEQLYYPSDTLGFKQVQTVEMDTSVFTEYKNLSGETMTFMQQVIQVKYSYDNEETSEERISVNNVEAIIFTKNGETTLIWCEYGYLFELSAPSSYDLISIAESLKK